MPHRQYDDASTYGKVPMKMKNSWLLGEIEKKDIARAMNMIPGKEKLRFWKLMTTFQYKEPAKYI